MGDIHVEFEFWKSHVDSSECEELEELEQDEQALTDAFYRELAFGTGGLRGIIGIGPNRMNTHTVGKATQGLADYLNAHYGNPSVAIARDSRNHGLEFAKTAACVLAANGIHALLYRQVEPTPALSFAVRDLGCSAGINVTASHNPAAYNGYKVYGPDGCQITSDAASGIQQAIDALAFFEDVRTVPFDTGVAEGLISWIDDAVLDRFIDAVAAQSVEPLDIPGADESLSVVYTPLNGTGLDCVTRILRRVGIDDVALVEEQAEPDGDFPTCPYPNPEFREALECGLALCDRVHPDLLLATDPDADRVGIAVPHGGENVLLTGNEVGVLLIQYLCEARAAHNEDLHTKVIVSTIVSSLMPDVLAKEYGFELRRVLTGFKYIGEQIAQLESAGQTDRFIFGFEESYGYMSGAYVRDKDAVNASMLICQMARWHKRQGRDLVDAMEALYSTYGYYLNKTLNVSYLGKEGADKMRQIMDGLRADPPTRIGGYEVAEFTDFAKGVTMPVINLGKDAPQVLPSANVLSFGLGEGMRVLIRPSGTEPKIKAYLFSKGAVRAQAEAVLAKLETSAQGLLT